MNSKLFKICHLVLLSTCSTVSTKSAVITHYLASTGFTVAFYPSENLSFCHYFSHLNSYFSSQDVNFPVFVAFFFFFFVFSTFNGPSDETLLVKIIWNHLCRTGFFVIIILLYQPLRYKYLFSLVADDAVPASHWILFFDLNFSLLINLL